MKTKSTREEEKLSGDEVLMAVVVMAFGIACVWLAALLDSVIY